MKRSKLFFLLLTVIFSGSCLACLGPESGFDIDAPMNDKGFFPVTMGYGTVSFHTKNISGARVVNTISCSAGQIGKQHLVLSSGENPPYLFDAADRPVNDFRYIKGAGGQTVGNVHLKHRTITRRTNDPVVTRVLTIDSPDRWGNRLVVTCVQDSMGKSHLQVDLRDELTRKSFQIAKHEIPTVRPRGGLSESKMEPVLSTESGTYRPQFNNCSADLVLGERARDGRPGRPGTMGGPGNAGRATP